MAFASTTTIYPDVSDNRNREKTTIYPYIMAKPDVPSGWRKRPRTEIVTQETSRDAYRNYVDAGVARAGTYVAWLDSLELAYPSGQPGAIIGGSAAQFRDARREAQAAYDIEVGVAGVPASQVSVSDDSGSSADLGATLDAIGDRAEGILDTVKRNPGTTAAIIGGAVLLFFIARRR